MERLVILLICSVVGLVLSMRHNAKQSEMLRQFADLTDNLNARLNAFISEHMPEDVEDVKHED